MKRVEPEFRPASLAVRLAEEIASWPVFQGENGLRIVVPNRAITEAERDMICRALRIYDLDC